MAINEFEFRYPIQVDTNMVNENGHIKLASYQEIIMSVVERHLEKINLGVPYLIAQFNLSWVLMSMSLEIKKHMQSGETYYATTWATHKKGIIYRREIIVRDKNDEVMFVATTFSSVLDLKTRRLSLDKAFHNSVQFPDSEELLSAESRIKLDGIEFEKVDTRKVYPSWIDNVGHVNNMRYGELAYDALSDKNIARIGELKRMEIYFVGELRANKTFDMLSTSDDDNVLIKGVLEGEETPAFVVKCLF